MDTYQVVTWVRAHVVVEANSQEDAQALGADRVLGYIQNTGNANQLRKPHLFSDIKDTQAFLAGFDLKDIE